MFDVVDMEKRIRKTFERLYLHIERLISQFLGTLFYWIPLDGCRPLSMFDFRFFVPLIVGIFRGIRLIYSILSLLFFFVIFNFNTINLL